ncbi:hypothetical protein GUITHDRAFT_149148 [Guillardia theta CCMP2712]|uniref:Uncharacterized protein n=1 Tax=Guillardia theta (strain CCMP2712) TaxID=905079 RepID=L1I5X6_GUITC|nr:hypothetical protein GUITHDRAFT_149148 [Guillardia theta CCMP2712]EKX31668.1 hypothetical protein GUITHDRAFT_149148 [Guillardia theta CCMP2712]|eukprot:XP_005818648.1 hypothetical protein GUITHDRAFT_149148 [Guillardia theta CCMP2712]
MWDALSLYGGITVLVASLFTLQMAWKRQNKAKAVVGNRDWVGKFMLKHKKWFPLALREVKAGTKESDWILWVFPIPLTLAEDEIDILSASRKEYCVPTAEEGIALILDEVFHKDLVEIMQALQHHGNPQRVFTSSIDRTMFRMSIDYLIGILGENPEVLLQDQRLQDLLVFWRDQTA